MKNKYFGDIGDYGKYGLLRFLAKSNVKIGVNWYLTEDDNSNDGRHTDYLNDLRFRHLDADLFDCLKDMVDSGVRDIKQFEKKDMIPNAVYYSKILDSKMTDVARRKEYRQNWHEQAMETLKDAELVFMDPDDGLVKENRYGTGSEKKVIPQEIMDYYDRGQDIIYYHHRGQYTKSDNWTRILGIMGSYIDDVKLIPIIYHRVQQRAYVFVLHEKSYEKYRNLIDAFLDSNWKGKGTFTGLA